MVVSTRRYCIVSLCVFLFSPLSESVWNVPGQWGRGYGHFLAPIALSPAFYYGRYFPGNYVEEESASSHGTGGGCTASFEPTSIVETRPVTNRESFDFIVVGAGAAGSVVASRLSENPDFKVLLLEAGPDRPILTDVPAMAPLFGGTDLNWAYQAEPQPGACEGYQNKVCSIVQGKVLGGGSTINYLFYIRGNLEDYNEWGRMGNYGWNSEVALHYFKKSEDQRNQKLARDKKFHGTGGPIVVDDIPFQNPLSDSFLAGFQELNVTIGDYHARNQMTARRAQTTQNQGYRCSAAKAFLAPARKRKNLKIITNALVTKILLNKKVAYGVQFEKDGKKFEAYAIKEIVVSAGAYESPKLLMLSGIGPADHLAEFNIPLKKNLSVGYNLQDHMIILGVPLFTVDKKVSFILSLFDAISAAFDYVLNQQGPLTTVIGLDINAFIKSKYADSVDGLPDIQLQLLTNVMPGGFPNLNPEIASEYFGKIPSPNSWFHGTTLLSPLSRGRLQLKSTDPHDKPLIFGNFYSNPADLLRHVEGLKFLLALSDTDALKAVGSNVYSTPVPGCADFSIWSDEYLACVLRLLAIPSHDCCTAKMGPSADPEAVVDPEFRVYGIRRLRVVDASVFPFIPRGNTNAPTIMIAERAADLLKSYWFPN